MKRRILLVFVVVLALVAAFAVTRARRLGLRVESFAVAPGEGAENAPQVGDDLPFEPFRFAVVGELEGDDHAALGRAMDGIMEREPVDFVLLSRIQRCSHEEAARLAAACRDRGVEVLAVGESADGEPPQNLALQTYVSPLSWSFRHRGWTFETGNDGPSAAVTSVRASATHNERSTTRTVLAGTLADRSMRLGGDLPVEIVRVSSHWANGIGNEEVQRVPRGPTLSSVWRDVALGVLFPVVRSTAGYVAVLAACALVAAIAFVRLRAQTRGTEPGTIPPRAEGLRQGEGGMPRKN